MNKRETQHANQCQGEECPSGMRNRYFRRKTLGATEFRVEQNYFLQRRRIINRSVHGWGVVGGFSMPQPGDGHVGPGLAFDRHGRELLLCEAVKVDERNTFVVDPAKPGETRPLRQAAPGVYLLRAHYAERALGDAALDPECGCDTPEKNFICETVVFSLMPLPDDDCCPCAEGPCQHKCSCGDDCCGAGRGPHARLCEWVEEAEVSCSSRLPCRWRQYQIDLCDPVPLACVTVVQSQDPCNPVGLGEVKDACAPRRLVKNNDLLYDLIRGCDLTHIDHISWAVFHRGERMSLDELKYFLGPGVVTEGKLTFARTLFRIRFSCPVLAETVTPDCFAFRVTLRHTDTGWFDQRVVPVIKSECDPPTSGDPANTTRAVTLCLHRKLYKEVTGEASAFDPQVNQEAVVEIDVYGDYILDCRNQPIDANARGYALRKPRPPDGQPVDDTPPKHLGNGTPGGSFLSIFHVDITGETDSGDRGLQQ